MIMKMKTARFQHHIAVTTVDYHGSKGYQTVRAELSTWCRETGDAFWKDRNRQKKFKQEKGKEGICSLLGIAIIKPCTGDGLPAPGGRATTTPAMVISRTSAP